MNVSFLRCFQVKKQFEEDFESRFVLNDVTKTFMQGVTYAIQGVSGTGKSTLMHILAGLDAPTSGTIFFNDESLAAMTRWEHEQFLQHSVGLLFQQPYLIRELTVAQNVILPAMIAGRQPETYEKEALTLLEAVGLLEKSDQKPGTLSGGQQQRVALARALINKPAFLLADEPTGNVDTKTGKKIVSLMLTLQKHWRMGIIVSTHDQYVAEVMQECLTLENGTLQR